MTQSYGVTRQAGRLRIVVCMMGRCAVGVTSCWNCSNQRRSTESSTQRFVANAKFLHFPRRGSVEGDQCTATLARGLSLISHRNNLGVHLKLRRARSSEREDCVGKQSKRSECLRESCFAKSKPLAVSGEVAPSEVAKPGAMLSVVVDKKHNHITGRPGGRRSAFTCCFSSEANPAIQHLSTTRVAVRESGRPRARSCLVCFCRALGD